MTDEVGMLIDAVSQTWKLRHKEVRHLFQENRASKWQHMDVNPGVCFCLWILSTRLCAIESDSEITLHLGAVDHLGLSQTFPCFYIVQCHPQLIQASDQLYLANLLEGKRKESVLGRTLQSVLGRTVDQLPSAFSLLEV